MMILDSKGITLNNAHHNQIYGPGAITANSKYLGIQLTAGSANGIPKNYGLYIHSRITDSHVKVGLKVYGEHTWQNVVNLGGDTSNTFTGDTLVTGASNYLALGKIDGAIAVQGNIRVEKGAWLRFDQDKQLGANSKVTLNNAGIYFIRSESLITDTINHLHVETSGVIQFEKSNLGANRYLYLNQLSIAHMASLTVRFWQDGRDHVLVKKSSLDLDLEKLLKNVAFTGRNQHIVKYRNYNKDYWEVYALPEPSTYGAALGACALAVLGLRRRKQRVLTRAPY